MNKILRYSLMLLVAMLSMQTWADNAAYTLTFPDENKDENGLTADQYTSTWDAKIGDMTWSIANFNNNNWKNSWSYIRCGRKNNASVATITNSLAMAKAITSVVATIDKVTADKVNNIKLEVSSSSDFSSISETVNASSIVQGNMQFKVSNPIANGYYRLTFDCASASSNGLVQVSKVEYFEGSSSTVTAPTISGTTPFTDKTTVTITVPTGTTVYYTTNGTEPTDEGDEYTAPFELDKTTTVKAVAYNAKGTAKSEVVTMEFVKQGKVTTTGDGTIANPYTVADAIALSNALPADTAYYKGTIKYIKEVDTGSFGNATYSITTAGSTDTLLVYRGYYLQAKKFTSKDQIKVGDEVIVRGKLINYNNTTLELGNRNYIYSLNGKTTDDATVNGESLPYEESFSTNQGKFTIKDVTMPENATQIWKHDTTEPYMKASGYVNRKNKDSESWLISPLIDLTKASDPRLTYMQTGKFFGTMADEASVWAKGENDADWTKLAVPTYMTGSDWNFVNDTISLKQFVGKNVQVAFKYVSTTNAAGTWEIKNISIKEYGSATPTPVADKGTEANPYTPAEANEAGKALASGTKSDKAIYVKGIVCSIQSVATNYGNARFYISEDGNTTSEQFYCFDCFNLNGAKFTNANEIAVGDEVVVTGQLQNYNGTIELARGGKIVKTNHGNKPAVEVTAANIAEFNAAENGAIVTLTLKDVQVTYSWTSSNGNTSIYLRDASGTTYIRNQKTDAVQLGYKTGDVLNGTIVLTRSEYNKAIQAVINDETNASTVTVTTGNAPVATEITCTDAKNNEANLVVLRNVDIIEDNTKFYIGTGADRLQVYNGFHLDGYTVAAATDVNVKGIITRYNDTYEIQPIEDPYSTTGINGVKTVENEKDAPVYNLAGQRVSKDYKGVVIQNGKKRINK